jgi:hypothetical protein
MNDRPIRVSTPPQAPQPMSQQPMQQPMPESHMPSGGGKSKLPWIVLAIIIIIIAAGAIIFREKLFGSKDVAMNSSSGNVKGISTGPSGYQAVFLTNGQVYFGKLSNTDTEWPVLESIYYLQVTQPPLQGSQENAQAQPAQQPQVSLVKLGQELHGPEDKMYIGKSQVLFWEPLKADSKVIEAIKSYEANPPK